MKTARPNPLEGTPSAPAPRRRLEAAALLLLGLASIADANAWAQRLRPRLPSGPPLPLLHRHPASGAVCSLLTARASQRLGSVAAAGPTPTPTVLKLSDCVKDKGSHPDVAIGTAPCGGPGSVVLIDRDFTGTSALGLITVGSGGVLASPKDIAGTLALETSGIVIEQGGTFSIGTPDCRVDDVAQVTLTFTGDAGATQKGIVVKQGGTLWLVAERGLPTDDGKPRRSWSALAAPAGPAAYGAGSGTAAPVTGDAKTIVVAGAVDWTTKDWLVVASTGYVADEAEFVRIASAPTFDGKNTTIHLDQALVHYHFGGDDPGPAIDVDASGEVTTPSGAASDSFEVDALAASPAQASRNYGVDERAEVGLVSRSIKLTATTPDPRDPGGNLLEPQPAGLHWGGVIEVQAGATVDITGTEIEKFGRGRENATPSTPENALHDHPIHFVGTPASAKVVANTIHHSFNAGIVLSGTTGLTFEENVVARAVGHLFYLSTGSEVGNRFVHNLGVGAMSPVYDGLVFKPVETAPGGFWSGDSLADENGYDGLQIASNERSNIPGNDGVGQMPACGFFLANVGTDLIGNSIAGVQGAGTGIQYLVPVTVQPQAGPIGRFVNNRVHGANIGLDTTAGPAPGSWNGANLLPISCTAGVARGALCDGAAQGQHQIAQFDGLTATRNRHLGMWARPGFYVVDNGRFAGNREGLSLVSGGGSEGVVPGTWDLVSNSVIVGISRNNPDRFGPCPDKAPLDCDGEVATFGTLGYPPPNWPLFGYMFYDGPARLEDTRLVNFRVDPRALLTTRDAPFLGTYEGDGAIGWMQTNVNVYPPTQYSEALTFQGADFRHRVYTAAVSQDKFVDGDKFTVVLDFDGTLSNLRVVDAGGEPLADRFPISLNNLPFLGVAGAGATALPSTSVDECEAEGALDATREKRPTALISPGEYATLEVGLLTPGNGYTRIDGITPCPCSGSIPNPGAGDLCYDAGNKLSITSDPDSPNCNYVTFEKDQVDYPGVAQHDVKFVSSAPDQQAVAMNVDCTTDHSCVALAGRNQQGQYEPKVMNGLGYTVTAEKGLPAFLTLGYTDAPVHAKPFRSRIGLCFKNAGGQAPPIDAFTLKRGRKSWGASNTGAPFSFDGKSLYQQLACFNLDFTNKNTFMSTCPSNPTAIEVKPVTPDTMPASLGGAAYYDQAAGMLFFDLVEDQPVAQGPSPLGSCPGSKGCPDESFYACPAEGCVLYTVQVGGGYAATGPSVCSPYPSYAQDYPAELDHLAYAGQCSNDPTKACVANENCPNGGTCDFSGSSAVKAKLVADPQFPHVEDEMQAAACGR